MTATDKLTFIADVINGFLLFAAIASIIISSMLTSRGLKLTRQQVEQNNKQLQQSHDIQKATFFKDLYLTMFGDKDIRDAFYLLDKNGFVYGAEFRGSSQEMQIDRLLSFADLLCALYSWHMLTEQEMQFFRYELMVIYNDPHIKAYLQFLKDAFKEETKEELLPFSSFISYCERKLY